MTESEVAAKFEAAIQLRCFGEWSNVYVGDCAAAAFDGRDHERKAKVWRRELIESMTDAFMSELKKGGQER